MEEIIYSIDKPSENMLLKIIKEIPIEPRNGYIKFLADGLKIPFNNKIFQEYQKECSKRKIIPNSKAIIEAYQGNTTITFNEESKGLENLFEGHRINEYTFNFFPLIYHAPHQEDFGTKLYKIKDSIMPTLLKNNYKISEFRFDLEHRTYRGVGIPVLIMSFNHYKENRKSIHLSKDIESGKEEIKPLKEIKNFLIKVSSEK